MRETLSSPHRRVAIHVRDDDENVGSWYQRLQRSAPAPRQISQMALERVPFLFGYEPVVPGAAVEPTDDPDVHGE